MASEGKEGEGEREGRGKGRKGREGEGEGNKGVVTDERDTCLIYTSTEWV